MTAAIELARPGDLASVLPLLERHQLPLEGARQLGETMVVARASGRVVGAAALEIYADAALLRSVVVDAGMQGQGIGQQLTAAAVALAAERGVGTLFLLTTTAAGFFARLGFAEVAREDVPALVRTSVEFESACPASAVVMRRNLSFER